MINYTITDTLTIFKGIMLLYWLSAENAINQF